MLSRGIFVVCVVAFTQCSTAVKETPAYVDLPDDLREIIADYRIQRIGLHKEMVFDGGKEALDLDTPNWEKELAGLLAVDLNKPAYKGRYQVDSSQSETGVTTIQYAALEPQTDIQWVKVLYESGKLTEAYVRKTERTGLYQSEQHFSIKRGEGYAISGTQDIRLKGSLKYHIHGTLRPISNQ